MPRPITALRDLTTSQTDTLDVFSRQYIAGTFGSPFTDTVAQNRLLNSADFATLGGFNALKRASGAYGPVLDYLTKLLSGDRQSMLEAASPEVNSVLSYYDSARKALSETAPRGSGRSTAIAESRFAESGDITNLLSKVRPEAAKELTTLGTALGQIGVEELGVGRESVANVLQYLLGQGDLQLGLRSQDIKVGEEVGGGIGLLIGTILAGL